MGKLRAKWSPELPQDLAMYELSQKDPEAYMKKVQEETGYVPEVELILSDKPLTGRMRQLIGTFTIDRDEFWKLTDAERQALHDKYAPGTKAPAFDPRFAEKYGKNPEGPF